MAGKAAAADAGAAGPMHIYRVPRSFKLRYELEMAEKGVHFGESKEKAKPKNPHEQWISFGLGDLKENLPYDRQLEDWSGTIIGPQNTNLGDRIYNVRMKCGAKYPDDPPQIWFVQKINMPGVNPQNGSITVANFIKWTPEYTMFDLLASIREQMTPAAKLKQPGAEEVYPV